jgi:hypothetical protein
VWRRRGVCVEKEGGVCGEGGRGVRRRREGWSLGGTNGSTILKPIVSLLVKSVDFTSEDK